MSVSAADDVIAHYNTVMLRMICRFVNLQNGLCDLARVRVRGGVRVKFRCQKFPNCTCVTLKLCILI